MTPHVIIGLVCDGCRYQGTRISKNRPEDMKLIHRIVSDVRVSDLRVSAAPSARESGKYPPSSTAQTRPPAASATPIREWAKWANVAGLT